MPQKGRRFGRGKIMTLLKGRRGVGKRKERRRRERE